MRKLRAVGTSFQKKNWEILFEGDVHVNGCNIRLVPDYNNKFDENAVKVTYENIHLGYMNRDDAVLYKSKFLEKIVDSKGSVIVKGNKRLIEFYIDLNDGKNHYVYKIINNINGCYYIGKRSCSCDIEKDVSYMGSGHRILSAIREYGVENFTKEILYSYKDEHEAYKKEAELVTAKEISNPLCYNLVEGGSNGYRRTLDSLKKIWDQIDVMDYLSFYRGLEEMSILELDVLEGSLQFENLNIKKYDSKLRSDEDRIKLWDMHFKRELIQLKKGKTTKEKLIKIYGDHDLSPLLEVI